MEFPAAQGYQRNSMWDFQGLIKNEVEFLGVTKKKSWNFQGSSILGLKFPRGVTQLCRISRSGALFCLEFPGVKQKNEKFQGVFQKSMSSTPPSPCLVFFSGIAQCS